MFQVLQYWCYTMNEEVQSQPEVGGAPVAGTARLAPEIPLGAGTLDLQRGEVRYADGNRCLLSEREAQLHRFLAVNAGRVVTRAEILSQVWRLNPTRIITRVIDMHIANLRDKLRDSADNARVLRTVYGQGYVFVAGEA